MISSLEWKMGGVEEEGPHDGEELFEAYLGETRFTYASSRLGDI